MGSVFVKGLSVFEKDDNSKTIYLNKEHLKQTDKKILKMGDGALHHIGYSSIKANIKNIVDNYKREGYRVIFEHEGKEMLLVYNK